MAVCADQLRLIAEAEALRLQTADPRNDSYEPWDDQHSARADLIEFLGTSVY